MAKDKSTATDPKVLAELEALRAGAEQDAKRIAELETANAQLSAAPSSEQSEQIKQLVETNERALERIEKLERELAEAKTKPAVATTGEPVCFTHKKKKYRVTVPQFVLNRGGSRRKVTAQELAADKQLQEQLIESKSSIVEPV